jgi:hypothetical protein
MVAAPARCTTATPRRPIGAGGEELELPSRGKLVALVEGKAERRGVRLQQYVGDRDFGGGFCLVFDTAALWRTVPWSPDATHMVVPSTAAAANSSWNAFTPCWSVDTSGPPQLIEITLGFRCASCTAALIASRKHSPLLSAFPRWQRHVRPEPGIDEGAGVCKVTP